MLRPLTAAVRETLFAARDAYVDQLLEEMDEPLPAIVNSRLSAVPTREKIVALEQEMRRYPPLTIVPVHYFAEGLYAREIAIPAGTLLTGKVHKLEHLNFVSQGDITVWTEDGMKRIRAPACIVSRPGTKRIGYTHAETVWTTVHATTATDLERIEAELIEPEAAAYIGHEGGSL